jgi:DNA ligase 1
MKPNLAYKITPERMEQELAKLIFPRIGSPKLDGIRCLVHSTGLLSRKLKLLPNEYTQATMPQGRLLNMDGELILGDPTDDPYHRTHSAVMTREGEPGLTLWVFDDYLMGGAYKDRYSDILKRLRGRTGQKVEVVEAVWLKNVAELLDYEMKCLKMGYEGIMTRNPDGRYKYGRSGIGPKEQGLVAHKRWKDGTARIVGMLPRMKNNNVAKTDETGAKKRSSHKANKVAQDTLGAMQVVDLDTKVEFELGTGCMTHEEAARVWQAYHDDPVGFAEENLAEYKYFPKGMLIAPRQPVWKGWRSPLDVSA